jgi:L-threonate 2-dehydrogenase
LGLKAGLDGELMLKMLTPSAGGSLQFQVRAPLMVARKYEPALAPITVLGKDLANIAPFAEALGCPSPLLRAAQGYFRKAYEAGLKDKDCAALFDIAAADSGIKLG